MCYSKSLTKSETEIEEHFERQFEIPLLFEPYYWLSGFDHPNVFIIPLDDPNAIWPATWGLIPEFGMDSPEQFRKKANTLNAKSEQVYNTRSYRKSIPDKRCLIIADGFYEPHHYNENSYPHYCRLKDKSLFTFAGIYTKLDEELYTCSILTVEANTFFGEIHNVRKRMPLVLDSEFENEWIRPDLEKHHIEELMRVGFIKSDFEAYPVNRNLYKTGFDKNTNKAIEKIDYPELGSQTSLF